MAETQQSLEDLLVDEKEINREILQELLSDYVRIGKQSGRLIPQKEFDKLTAERKVLVTLLSQHAQYELEMAEAEWLTPATIGEQSGLKAGTVRPMVKQLKDKGVIEDDDGSYRVPTHGLARAQKYIEESDNEQ